MAIFQQDVMNALMQFYTLLCPDFKDVKALERESLNLLPLNHTNQSQGQVEKESNVLLTSCEIRTELESLLHYFLKGLATIESVEGIRP
jgi:hypothetical protein